MHACTKWVYTIGGEHEISPLALPLPFPVKIVFLFLWIFGLSKIHVTARGFCNYETATIEIYINQIFASTKKFPLQLVDTELHEYLHLFGLNDKQIDASGLFDKTSLRTKIVLGVK